jgi:hypothetical protein
LTLAVVLESILGILSARHVTKIAALLTFYKIYESGGQRCVTSAIPERVPSPKIRCSIAVTDGNSGHSCKERRHLELNVLSQSVADSIAFAAPIAGPTSRKVISAA